MDNLKLNDESNINISNEVLSTIAGIAANEIEGVVDMEGNIKSDITDILGFKNLSKGVKVTVEDEIISVDLNIIVEYGFKLDEISIKVQKNVKKAIESMTGMIVNQVNINIVDVKIPKKEDLNKETL